MSDFKLHKIYEPSNEYPVADIVFIHGLDGDAKKTWNYKDKKDEIFWPNWLIDHFPLLQIWTLDHPSKMFASLTKGDEMDFFKRTVAILDYLISNDIGLRPLIFVCHSLGGVLTKALLRKSQDTDVEEYKGIIENTLGVVFLATPHLGTSLANYANFTFSPFSDATKELKKENPILVDLYDWYRSNAPQKNIATKAFFETQKYKKLPLIVPQSSASPGTPKCDPIPVNADHFAICKFGNKKNPTYLSVIKFIELQFEKNNVDVCDTADSDDFEYFTSVIDGGRKSLREKLTDGDREHEITDAEKEKERVAIQLAKNNLSGAFRKEQEIFLRNTKLRFKHSVYPKIRQNEDESTVNDAVEEKVITPMTKMNVMFCGKKPHFADVKAALYYLTGNCHIKWSKDDV